MTGVLLLCDDLLFGSKVTATARAHGVSATVARTPAAAVAKMQATAFATIIVDLHLPNLDIDDFVAAAKSGQPLSRLVGFGSHVDVETLKAARSAGVDPVMPRSQFSAQLEERMTEWGERNRIGPS